MAVSVVLYWRENVLYTRSGQAWDRDITLTDAALMASAMSDEGTEHVVIRKGLPTRR